MPAVQAMHQAQRQEGLPFQVVGPQCVMVQHHEQEAHPVLLAHLSRHQEFEGLIKQRVKVLLVPLGLQRASLGNSCLGSKVRWTKGSLEPLDSRSSRLEVLSSSTCSFCSEAR